jgi:hypothetical protein
MHPGAHARPRRQTVDEIPVDVLIRPYKKYDLTPLRAAGNPVDVGQLGAVQVAGGFTVAPGDIAVFDFGWERCRDRVDELGRSWWGRNEPGLADDA